LHDKLNFSFELRQTSDTIAPANLLPPEKRTLPINCQLYLLHNPASFNTGNIITNPLTINICSDRYCIFVLRRINFLLT